MKYFISNPIKFGTSENERSSIGHAFHNWLTALIVSKKSNIEFIHTPFSNDCTRYENFLNFKHSFKTIENVNIEKIYQVPLIDFAHLKSTQENVAEENIQKLIHFINDLPDNTGVLFSSYSQFPGILIKDAHFSIEKIQESYWSKHENTKTNFDKSKFNVAIHIRRGDITKQTNFDRWKDLTFYKKIIEKINKTYKGCDIHVYSEGIQSDFSELFIENVKFHLNGSDVESLHDMCSANILVTGQSSFSIMASYINKNTIIYTPLHNLTRWESFGNRFINVEDFLND